MHRDPLLSQILRYASRYPDETSISRRFITFIQKNPDCFKRELTSGHITGSAWIVDGDRKQVLLTHHRKLNKWLQLGGHADGETDVLSVALREGYEESGLNQLIPFQHEIFDLDIHLIPKYKNTEAHYHFDVRFALKADSSEQFKVSEESHDLSWIKINALEEVTTETSMIRMKKKWLAINQDKR